MSTLIFDPLTLNICSTSDVTCQRLHEILGSKYTENEFKAMARAPTHFWYSYRAKRMRLVAANVSAPEGS